MGTMQVVEGVDFNDPLTILLANEGVDADDVHASWTSGRARTRTVEVEVYKFETEPNIDKFCDDETYKRRFEH